MFPTAWISNHLGKSTGKLSPGGNKSIASRIGHGGIQKNNQTDCHEEKTVSEPSRQGLTHDPNFTNIIAPRSADDLSIFCGHCILHYFIFFCFFSSGEILYSLPKKRVKIDSVWNRSQPRRRRQL